jgi:steroid 5-alpha reductase family enzyme
MTAKTRLPGFQITQLAAINVAKVITIVCLIGIAITYGIHDQRQVIYLSLHISYCCWWLLEQWLFPTRQQHVFTEIVGLSTFIFILLFVGVFYAFPGYLAFTNPQPISYLTVAIAIPLYIFGSLINTAADIQKMAAKEMGASLVQDGIWRFLRYINYLGDLMRYTSFSVVAGSLWAFLLPLSTLLLYIQRISQKEKSMMAKYPDFADYQNRSSRLIPWIW